MIPHSDFFLVLLIVAALALFSVAVMAVLFVIATMTKDEEVSKRGIIIYMGYDKREPVRPLFFKLSPQGHSLTEIQSCPFIQKLFNYKPGFDGLRKIRLFISEE